MLPPPARIGAPADDIDTPALVIDLDAFEDNLAAMASYTAKAGVRLRPHAKTHKSPMIAHKQMALGAVGQCVQKVAEAEEALNILVLGADRAGSVNEGGLGTGAQARGEVDDGLHDDRRPGSLEHGAHARRPAGAPRPAPPAAARGPARAAAAAPRPGPAPGSWGGCPEPPRPRPVRARACRASHSAAGSSAGGIRTSRSACAEASRRGGSARQSLRTACCRRARWRDRPDTRRRAAGTAHKARAAPSIPRHLNRKPRSCDVSATGRAGGQCGCGLSVAPRARHRRAL